MISPTSSVQLYDRYPAYPAGLESKSAPLSQVLLHCNISSASATMPSTTQPAQPLPVYFIGHAGVSLLFSETENNHIVQDNLRAIGDEIRAIYPPPKAIITFSGHFEAGEIHGPGVIEGVLGLFDLEIIHPADSHSSQRKERHIYPGEW
jgi:hypothetical protein